MTGVLADIARHWYIDLSIPLVAAAIGYLTKLVAIRMMFEPKFGKSFGLGGSSCPEGLTLSVVYPVIIW